MLICNVHLAASIERLKVVDSDCDPYFLMCDSGQVIFCASFTSGLLEESVMLMGISLSALYHKNCHFVSNLCFSPLLFYNFLFVVFSLWCLTQGLTYVKGRLQLSYRHPAPRFFSFPFLNHAVLF